MGQVRLLCADDGPVNVEIACARPGSVEVVEVGFPRAAVDAHPRCWDVEAARTVVVRFERNS